MFHSQSWVVLLLVGSHALSNDKNNSNHSDPCNLLVRLIWEWIALKIIIEMCNLYYKKKSTNDTVEPRLKATLLLRTVFLGADEMHPHTFSIKFSLLIRPPCYYGYFWLSIQWPNWRGSTVLVMFILQYIYLTWNIFYFPERSTRYWHYWRNVFILQHFSWTNGQENIWSKIVMILY